MAPLKFEDSIKENLDQRTIKPSSGSWNRLEQQLNDKNYHKKNKNYWWLGVAASITGILILSIIFMTSDKKVQQKNRELVDVHEKEQEEHQSTKIVTLKPEKPEPVLEIKIKDKKGPKKSVVQVKNYNQKKTHFIKEYNKENSKTGLTKGKIDLQENTVENHTREVVAVTTDSIKDNMMKEDQILHLDPKMIESKIAGLIAKVKELEEGNKKVTDQEVEALLKKAQQEITTAQILKSNTVSASALLQDVEYELDESFKDRVFEALKTGFEKIKTSVAERDN